MMLLSPQAPGGAKLAVAPMSSGNVKGQPQGASHAAHSSQTSAAKGGAAAATVTGVNRISNKNLREASNNLKDYGMNIITGGTGAN